MLKILVDVLKLVCGGVLMIIAAIGIYLNFYDILFLFFNVVVLLVGLLLFFTPIRTPRCIPSTKRRIKPRVRRASVKP